MLIDKGCQFKVIVTYRKGTSQHQQTYNADGLAHVGFIRDRELGKPNLVRMEVLAVIAEYTKTA